jgi:hypothetical protein
MIRKLDTKDKNSCAIYLATKLNISFSEALLKVNKILKSGLPNFLKDERDLQGICWVESRLIGDKKEKYIEILVNNWRLAENFIQILRWNLNGDFYLSIPKHSMLNRTYNKNGIRYLRVDGLNNLYIYRFEKRRFYNNKSDDNE